MKIQGPSKSNDAASWLQFLLDEHSGPCELSNNWHEFPLFVILPRGAWDNWVGERIVGGLCWWWACRIFVSTLRMWQRQGLHTSATLELTWERSKQPCHHVMQAVIRPQRKHLMACPCNPKPWSRKQCVSPMRRCASNPYDTATTIRRFWRTWNKLK